MTTALFSSLAVLMVAGSSVEARLTYANDSTRIAANNSGTLLSSADAADPYRSALAVFPQPTQVGALTLERPNPIVQQPVQLLPAGTVVEPSLAVPALPQYDVQTSSTAEMTSYAPSSTFAFDDFDTPFDVQAVPEPSTRIAGGIGALLTIAHFLRNCDAMRRCEGRLADN